MEGKGHKGERKASSRVWAGPEYQGDRDGRPRAWGESRSPGWTLRLCVVCPESTVGPTHPEAVGVAGIPGIWLPPPACFVSHRWFGTGNYMVGGRRLLVQTEGLLRAGVSSPFPQLLRAGLSGFLIKTPRFTG